MTVADAIMTIARYAVKTQTRTGLARHMQPVGASASVVAGQGPTRGLDRPQGDDAPDWDHGGSTGKLQSLFIVCHGSLAGASVVGWRKRQAGWPLTISRADKVRCSKISQMDHGLPFRYSLGADSSRSGQVA